MIHVNHVTQTLPRRTQRIKTKKNAYKSQVMDKTSKHKETRRDPSSTTQVPSSQPLQLPLGVTLLGSVASQPIRKKDHSIAGLVGRQDMGKT